MQAKSFFKLDYVFIPSQQSTVSMVGRRKRDTIKMTNLILG